MALKKKTLGLIGLSLVIIVLFIPMFLNFSGYCMAKHRWLSDNERIKLAILSLLNQKIVQVYVPDKGYISTKLEYSGYDQFIEENPNCCHVNPRGPYDLPQPSLLDRLLGYNSAEVVEISFPVKYEDDETIKTKIITSQSFQTNCGVLN